MPSILKSSMWVFIITLTTTVKADNAWRDAGLLQRSEGSEYSQAGENTELSAIRFSAGQTEQEGDSSNDWSDDWGDDWEEESPHSWGNQLSYAVAPLIKSDAVNRDDLALNEFRWSTDYEYVGEAVQFNFEADLLADALLDEYDIDTFAVNLAIPIGDNQDLKVGRQVITWGTGDLLFLNDLFPKDWQSFFSGRDERYLKPGVDAIRYSYYGSSINFEIALMPEFEPDRFITGERLSFYSPVNDSIVQPQQPLSAIEEDSPEIAGRIFSTSGNFEWAVYLYSGYFKSPSKISGQQLAFSEMDSLGASIRTAMGSGLFNAEMSYYSSREDSRGTDPLIANDEFRLLLGYEQETAKNWTLGLQAYLEKILDYDELTGNIVDGADAPEEDSVRLTARITQLAMQQKWRNSLMVFYSPSDEDYYLRFTTNYRVNDNWQVSGGLNWLDGESPATFLSQLQDNSNWFVKATYVFDS